MAEDKSSHFISVGRDEALASAANGSEVSRVYFPVESLVGLGHFNRTGQLVRSMTAQGMDVTVASGTFVDPERFFGDANIVELPTYVLQNKSGKCYTIAANGERTHLPDYDMEEYAERRAEAHSITIESTRPNVTVSEFWPFDRPAIDGEMESVLTVSKEVITDNIAVVSVRDVLDVVPDEQLTEDERAEKQERLKWVVDKINADFDAVLVHGDPNFIPLSETFARAAELKTPVFYTGYVVSDLPKWSEADKENAPMLVSCGSGVDGHEMIYAFLTAWEKLLERSAEDSGAAEVTNRPLHVITGPRFAPKAFEYVVDWVQELQDNYGIDAKVDNYRTDYTDLLAQAAFSISLAGYNTTLETLAVGTPSLFIPKYAVNRGKMRWSTEQLYRLERLEEKDYGRFVHPEQAQDSDVFAEIVQREFLAQTGPDRKQKAQLNFDGAANTVKIIQQLLEGQGQDISAVPVKDQQRAVLQPSR